MKVVALVTLHIPDTPGSFAKAASLVKDKNIRAIMSYPSVGSVSTLYLVFKPEDVADAKNLLEAYAPKEQQILEFDIAHKPGQFLRIARALSGAGVNMDCYFGLGGMEEGKGVMYVTVDKIEKAKEACVGL